MLVRYVSLIQGHCIDILKMYAGTKTIQTLMSIYSQKQDYAI